MRQSQGRRQNLVRIWLLLMIPALGSTGCTFGYVIEHKITPQVDPWVGYPRVGTICVLRPDHGEFARTYHYDNNRLVGVTQRQGSYFCYLARPGWHRLTLSARGNIELSLLVQPKRQYYVQMHAGRNVTLYPVSKTLARHLLPHMSYAYVTPSGRNARRLYYYPVPARIKETPDHSSGTGI